MSRQIKIGNLTLGGGAPIRVQSMTNTDTMDTQATVEQALRIYARSVFSPEVRPAYMRGEIAQMKQ